MWWRKIGVVKSKIWRVKKKNNMIREETDNNKTESNMRMIVKFKKTGSNRNRIKRVKRKIIIKLTLSIIEETNQINKLIKILHPNKQNKTFL